MIGNDLADGKVVPDPIVCEKVTLNITSDDEDDNLYPAVTRAITRRLEMKADHSTDAVTKDASPNIDSSFPIDDNKTSTKPQNIRKNNQKYTNT